MCEACNDSKANIRQCPLDENEISLLNRLREMPGKQLAARVPAWAKPKPVPTPFRFVAGAKPVYPARCMPNTITKGKVEIPTTPAGISVAEYVRAVEKANRLTHA
jgi:hypothetical protein